MSNGRIIHVITGLGDGGAEAVLYRMCLSDKENEHLVISMMGMGKYGALLNDINVSVECLNMPQGKLRYVGLKRLWNIMRREQRDCIKEKKNIAVQTWMYHGDLIGGLFSRLAGISNVVWGIHHTVLEKKKTKRATRWIARVNAILSYWVPQKIVCCAEKSRIVHEAQGFDASKMRVIPNGYDLQKFTPDHQGRFNLRAEWGVSEGVFLLGMVGRFDPQKNHENLIAALELLKERGLNFKCVLVGREMDKHNLYITQLLKQHQVEDNVLLLGQRNDIPAVMSALDLHVLSSSAEAFPNVLAEAMACQTPCVTTDVGDAALIVGDTGWVVPSENSQALATGIIAAMVAMEDSDAWQSRCVAARQWVSLKFSLQKMLASYQEVWGVKSNLPTKSLSIS